jgi:hypothetical protein
VEESDLCLPQWETGVVLCMYDVRVCMYVCLFYSLSGGNV